ncbi:MAG: radical superfamily enzyme [Eubacterium sp.]|nr:radical superfamily enzyme [Eubacterium sp.]
MHISIMISNECNYNCSHCIESSSLNESERLPLSKLTGLIDAAGIISASENGNLRISFTGGEPFLHFNDLLECAKTAKRNGAYRIDCITNCFWAADFDNALKLLKEVKNAGIDHLSFSYDQYHSSFIELEQIKNAFKAAVESGIEIKFKIILFKGSERAYEFLEKISDITPGKRFSMEELPGLPLGRAMNLERAMFLFGEGIPSGKCQGIGNMLVTYDGDVYPCCCPTFSEALCLGNVHTDSFYDIYQKMNKSSLLKILMTFGPYYFVPFLKKQGIEFPEGTYVDIA